MTKMHTGIRMIADTASTSWLGVDWGAILLVLVVALIATVVITSSFALGTRLLAVGAPDVVVVPGGEADDPSAVSPPRTTPRPVGATVGAWACYAVGIAATLYGIYLVIPLFHS